MRQNRFWHPLAAFVLLLGVATSSLADGTQTGILAGTVVDERGAGIEGASVTLRGPQGSRSATTDAEGRFRFPALGLGR